MHLRPATRHAVRVPAAASLYAEEQGWLQLEGAHSACLTEEGKRLIAKEKAH